MTHRLLIQAMERCLRRWIRRRPGKIDYHASRSRKRPCAQGSGRGRACRRRKTRTGGAAAELRHQRDALGPEWPG